MQDKTLRHAFNQVKVIDGQPLHSKVALSFPYFTGMKNITSDTQTKEETVRNVIPDNHNPMAGHLGQDKTLNHLMAHFY